jgi:hypothetical protein
MFATQLSIRHCRLDPAIHHLRKTLREEGWREISFVMAGLDPAIHPLRKSLFEA